MNDLGDVYARARSSLAALADSAMSCAAAADYEEVLLVLDGLAPAPRRPLAQLDVAGKRRADVFEEVRGALVELSTAVGALELTLCLAMLGSAWRREQAS